LRRVPYTYNLRTDPYEFARITSNTYWDWLFDHAWILYPMGDVIGPFLNSFTFAVNAVDFSDWTPE
jgi:arylsulfatase